jgi:drug/metabolite transporter (DMT)-like permease
MNSRLFIERKNKKILLNVRIGIGLTIALDTAIQLSWKTAVANVPSSASAWYTIMLMFRQPLFYIIMILLLFQFINWMMLLSKADLSYVQPLTALSLASVTGFSYLLLHERISLQRVAGMVLILAGVWFIGMTKHKTALDVSNG